VLDLEAVVGLPYYEVTGVSSVGQLVRIEARYVGGTSCPKCDGTSLRHRGLRIRRVRHENIGERACELMLESRKWRCRGCGKSFWQRFPGILPCKRASEPFRRLVAGQHRDGISRHRLGERLRIGSATVERWFQDCLGRKARELSPECPRQLGIDEHFFSKKGGYATTFCNLATRRVHDVVLGRSEASLEGYLNRMTGKDQVEYICMDLSVTYRAVARKHFPSAKIVADRFHVIRVVNHHFLAAWKAIDPQGAKNRGLVSLIRRHRSNLKDAEQESKLDSYLAGWPGLGAIYEFKQQFCALLCQKHCTAQKCRQLAPKLLEAIDQLLDAKLTPLVTLGETLRSWQQEIAAMWRFTKNNGITEGLHNKMENLKRQAYGFRNFENYRLRVRVMCC
jgi:transposase